MVHAADVPRGETSPTPSREQPRAIRVAYVVSHPIQYQAELLRSVAADPAIDLTVLFCSDFSVRAYRDEGFGIAVEWDVPLTDGYRHIVLPRWRDNSSPRPLAPISRGFFRILHRGIDGQPFDALWLHGYNSVNALHAMLAARLLGLPVLLRAEPWLSDRQRSAPKLWLKRGFFHLLQTFVSAVLPIGSRNRDYCAHYFGTSFPSFLVPYAVDNDFFARGSQAASATRDALQRELALESGRPVILFASKLQHRKHCDHLLQAFLQLPDSPSAPYLLIVGDGEEIPALRQEVQQSGTLRVRFAGFRKQRELPRFFDLITVFVLPSQHEAWGLIVNEAMASGLPVIVSDDVGCAADLVCQGENGFVYPFGDVEALSNALHAVLQRGVAEQMGLASRQRIAHWGYREDLDGLKAAFTYCTRLPLHPATASEQTAATEEADRATAAL